eukprot:TRINITY_DN7948_c0_g6_i1.p1 TRINITY_DN7948_c0_g6~~TRINITY_DN7948_c0_g6_i1.p1  ORF type:complete len:358 (+),score=119.28 TRINITY_DN7948_c0_g6_i1:93-1166(+)
MSRFIRGAARRMLTGSAGAALGAGAFYARSSAWAHQAGSVRSEQTDSQYVTSLPVHLQNMQRRFKHYADFTDPSTGQPLISAAGFLRSILGVEKDEIIAPHAIEHVERRFKEWEPQHGGKLSFDAFSMYQTMLRTSQADADRAFLLFDDNETMSLNRAQFVDMMSNLCFHADKTAVVDGKSGYAASRFGSMHERELSYAQWHDDVNALKGEVWLGTFGHYDRENSGALSPRDFVLLALISVGFTGASAKRRVDKTFHPTVNETLKIEDEYDASAWVALNQLVNHRYRVAEILNMCKSRFPLTPDRFYDVLRASELHISRSHSDIIMAVCDRTGQRELTMADVTSTLALFGRSGHGTD